MTPRCFLTTFAEFSLRIRLDKAVCVCYYLFVIGRISSRPRPGPEPRAFFCTAMIRVVALIDGFNLYHAINNLGDNRLKWCDVAALCRAFLPPSETLTETRFYTAYPGHFPADVRGRYDTYTAALAASGVKIVSGHFKSKDLILKIKRGYFERNRRILKAKHSPPDAPTALEIHYRRHEEKETDVNLALDLLDFAHGDKFHKCLIVSGDSDLMPAIKRVQQFPQKSLVVLTPPKPRNQEVARYLRDIAAATPDNRFVVSQIRKSHIAGCRLPDEIAEADGGIIRCPKDYL